MLRQIVGTSATRVYVLVGSLLFLALSARLLGPEGRGLLALMLTWARLISNVGHFSLGQVTLRYATAQQDNQWFAEVIWVLIAGLGLVTVGQWLFFGGALMVGDLTDVLLPTAVIVLTFLLMPLMTWETYQAWSFMGLGDVGKHNWALTWGRTVTLLLCPLMLVWGVSGGLLAFVLGQVVVVLYGAVHIRRRLTVRPTLHYGRLKQFFKQGLAVHPAWICTILIASVDIVMLGAITGPVASGYYQLAVQLVAAMLALPYAALASFSAKSAEVGADAAWQQSRKLVWGVLAVMVLGAALAALVMPYAIPIIFGADFTPVSGIYQVLLLTLPGQTLMHVMLSQWISRGLFKQISLLSAALAVLNIGLNSWLIPDHGITGALIATVSVYLAATVCQLIFMLWLEKRAKAG